MFADDVCLYTIGKSVREVQMSVQKCVTNADDWYVSNLLSVNTTKRFIMDDQSSFLFLVGYSGIDDYPNTLSP